MPKAIDLFSQPTQASQTGASGKAADLFAATPPVPAGMGIYSRLDVKPAKEKSWWDSVVNQFTGKDTFLQRTGDVFGHVGIGFAKEAGKRVAEASVLGEKTLIRPIDKVLGTESEEKPLGEQVIESKALEPVGLAEKAGSLAERFVEAYLGVKVMGSATTMKQAFAQGSAITESQLTLSGVGKGDDPGKAAFDAIPYAALSGGISAATFGLLNWLSGKERGLAKTFNRELQPPTKEMAEQFKRGYATVGDDIASVMDDSGKPVYVGKSYEEMGKTAQREIADNSNMVRGYLRHFDELDIAAPEGKKVVFAEGGKAFDDMTSHFDTTYGAQLTKAQENILIKEAERLPVNMTREQMLDVRQSIDADIKPGDFSLKEGPKAFVAEVRLYLRDWLRKAIEGSVPNTPEGNVVRELNGRISTAYDVRDLSGLQRAVIEKAKISKGEGIWAFIRNVWDNVLFAPERSTVIPGALKSAAQAQPAIIGVTVTEIKD